MLKYRLIFGVLMTIVFILLVLLDGWLDGSLDGWTCRWGIESPIMTILCVIVAGFAAFELKALIVATGAAFFTPVVIAFVIVLSAWPSLCQYFGSNFSTMSWLVPAACAILLYQAWKFRTSNVIRNCGVNLFAIFYIGLLSYLLEFRINFGLFSGLMLIFTIKCADIGAYIAGKFFGRTALSPVISPAKTVEGFIGGIILAMVTASLFSIVFDIMSVLSGLIFGFVMAVIGQASDLAESLLKRDARQKDSSAVLPGFGGLLDLIDSLLIPAPIACWIFKYFLM